MGLKVGDDSKAYRYLRRAAFIDLLNMQGNTREGIHAANTGGVWQTIVFGFAGVAQREDGIVESSSEYAKGMAGINIPSVIIEGHGLKLQQMEVIRQRSFVLQENL